MNVLVTGDTGFVGGHVVNALKRHGYFPYGPGDRVRCDLRSIYDAKAQFWRWGDIGAVIHCAAKVGSVHYADTHAGETYHDNVLMTLNVMELARKANVKVFINVISNCVYPDSNEPFKETDILGGLAHDSVMGYAYAKRATYMMALSYRKQYGMNVVSVVMPNMYGPGENADPERSHALGAIIRKALKAREDGTRILRLWGGGSPIREWLYAEDAAEAMVRCMDTEVPLINIGSGIGMSMFDLVDCVISEVDRGSIAGRWDEIWDSGMPRGTDHKTMDVRLMKEILKWEPPTGIVAGIRKTIEWLKEEA